MFTRMFIPYLISNLYVTSLFYCSGLNLQQNVAVLKLQFLCSITFSVEFTQYY